MKRRPPRPKGSGGIRNRGTDRFPRWFAYYSVILNGERRQISEGPFRLKSQAEDWLKEELRRKNQGRSRVPTQVTVGELFAEWLAIREHDLEPNTYSEYRRVEEHRIRPRIGTVKVKDLAPGHIAQMLDELRKPGANRRGKATRRLSETSLQHTFDLLNTACEWAVRRRYITFNPCDDVDRPKRGKTAIQVWSPPQLAAFLDHTKTDRLHPFLRLATHTGMRRSELLGLRWPDVDLTAGTLSIRRKRIKVGAEMVERDYTKTSTGMRVVDLDPATISILGQWSATQLADRMSWGAAWQGGEPGKAGHVFTTEDGRPLHADHVAGRYERLVSAAANVTAIRFHDLRHTHATLMLKAGRPLHEVAARLGHSPTVCLSIYAHVLPKQGAEGAAAFAGLVESARESIT